MSTSIEKTEALYPTNLLRSTKHFKTVDIEGQSYIRLDKMTTTQMRTFLTLLHGFKQTTFFPVVATFADGTTLSINVDSMSLYTVKNAKKQIEKQNGTPRGEMQVFIKREYKYIPMNAELSALESVALLYDNHSGENRVVEEYDDNDYRVIEATDNTVIQAGDELHVQRLLSNNRTFTKDDYDIVVLDIYNKDGTVQAQWRKATVVHAYNEYVIKIHYCGWDKAYDFTLDLSLDAHKRRISHESMLHEKQSFVKKFTKMGLNDEKKMASDISTVESLRLTDEQL